MKKILTQYSTLPQLPTVQGWKEVPIRTPLLSWFKEDPLVPIGLFTDYSRDFFVDPIYAGLMNSSPYKYNELEGCLVGAYLRRSIVEKLIQASQKLKPRHMFLIWDAYRPLSVQKALFDFFVQKMVTAKGGEVADYYTEAQKFVSLPSSDPKKPSPHSTGAVVDLTIIEFSEKGWSELQELNTKLSNCKDEKERFKIELRRFQIMRTESSPIPMGTPFDEMSDEADLYFYEDKIHEESDVICRLNRRYLFSTLWNVGFVGYEAEWWHYSSGDQFWAKKLGKTARFGAAEWNTECDKHEKIMKQVVKGIVHILDKTNIGAKLQARHLLYDFVSEVVKQTGDVRETSHPKAISI